MKKLIVSLCSVAALGLGVAQAENMATDADGANPNAYKSQTPDELVKNSPGPASTSPETDADPRAFKSQTPGAMVRDTISQDVVETRGNERVGVVEEIPTDQASDEDLEGSYQRQDPDSLVRDTISEETSEELYQ